jgi:hypothetical protein
VQSRVDSSAASFDVEVTSIICQRRLAVKVINVREMFWVSSAYQAVQFLRSLSRGASPWTMIRFALARQEDVDF